MYIHHCQNLKEIENAINLVEIDLRRYISAEKDAHVYRYTKILSYLITCWTEVRVLKLTFERNAFTPTEIDSILKCSLENKWVSTLEIAISKAYNINRNGNISNQLDFTARARYNEIVTLIKNDLVPSIEIRNRIAHGHWLIAFTNDLKNKSEDLTRQIRTENIVTLQLKKKLLSGLSQLIHDLAVSPSTFERDFDRNYRLIEQNKRNLHKRNYQVYKKKMVEKYKRGQDKKTK